MERDRVVMAFGGGADDETAIARVAAHTGQDVVTVTLDTGRGRELESVRQRALDAGALRAHVIDARERLAREVILPALAGGVFAHGARPRIIEVSRTLVARALAEVVEMERATSVAHAASAAERDILARLLIDLVPGCRLVTPGPASGHEWSARRPAQQPGLDVQENLWGRVVRLSAPVDEWVDPPASVYALTAGGKRRDLDPAVVEITVENGEPVAVNGVSMGLAELIEVVGTIAGDHGVGRSEAYDWTTGARDVSEAPAAAVLGAALGEIERAVLEPSLLALKAQLSAVYGSLLDEGRWFSPGRQALAAFMQSIQARVSGSVRLQLLGGACRVTGRRFGHRCEAVAATLG
jgi:argininosuccinate synthase